MIQTQLLRLDPPYNYIFHGGIVAKQVATLMVAVDKTDKEGNYGLETHSHPVVVYNGDTAEGVTWDQVEVMECRTVCSETDKRVTLKKFNELLMMTSVHNSDVPMNPEYMRSALHAAGISLTLPTDYNYYGPDQFGTLKDYKIKLIFTDDEGEYYAWSHYDQSPLYFSVKASSRQELAIQLLMQLDNWKRALEEFKISITFEAGSQEDVMDDIIEYDEDEVNKIIDRLNKAASRE